MDCSEGKLERPVCKVTTAVAQLLGSRKRRVSPLSERQQACQQAAQPDLAARDCGRVPGFDYALDPARLLDRVVATPGGYQSLLQLHGQQLQQCHRQPWVDDTQCQKALDKLQAWEMSKHATTADPAAAASEDIPLPRAPAEGKLISKDDILGRAWSPPPLLEEDGSPVCLKQLSDNMITQIHMIPNPGPAAKLVPSGLQPSRQAHPMDDFEFDSDLTFVDEDGPLDQDCQPAAGLTNSLMPDDADWPPNWAKLGKTNPAAAAIAADGLSLNDLPALDQHASGGKKEPPRRRPQETPAARSPKPRTAKQRAAKQTKRRAKCMSRLRTPSTSHAECAPRRLLLDDQKLLVKDEEHEPDAHDVHGEVHVPSTIESYLEHGVPDTKVPFWPAFLYRVRYSYSQSLDILDAWHASAA